MTLFTEIQKRIDGDREQSRELQSAIFNQPLGKLGIVTLEGCDGPITASRPSNFAKGDAVVIATSRGSGGSTVRTILPGPPGRAGQSGSGTLETGGIEFQPPSSVFAVWDLRVPSRIIAGYTHDKDTGEVISEDWRVPTSPSGFIGDAARITILGDGQTAIWFEQHTRVVSAGGVVQDYFPPDAFAGSPSFQDVNIMSTPVIHDNLLYWLEVSNTATQHAWHLFEADPSALSSAVSVESATFDNSNLPGAPVNPVDVTILGDTSEPHGGWIADSGGDLVGQWDLPVAWAADSGQTFANMTIRVRLPGSAASPSEVEATGDFYFAAQITVDGNLMDPVAGVLTDPESLAVRIGDDRVADRQWFDGGTGSTEPIPPFALVRGTGCALRGDLYSVAVEAFETVGPTAGPHYQLREGDLIGSEPDLILELEPPSPPDLTNEFRILYAAV